MRSVTPHLSTFILRFAVVLLVPALLGFGSGVALAASPVEAAYVANYNTFRIENLTTAEVTVVVSTDGTITQTRVIPARSEVFVARGGGSLSVRYEDEVVATATAGASTRPAPPMCASNTATIWEGQPGSVRAVQSNAWSFVGTTGNDTIVGTAGVDSINAGSGNDTICGGGEGADGLIGGPGDDTFFLNGGETISGGTGYDVADGRVSPNPITLNVGGSGIERAYGSTRNDLFTSTTVPDAISGVVIDGLGGDDEITGSPGRDVLYGRAGDDTIDGGSGDDLIYGGDDDDTINAGAGFDTITGEAGVDGLNGGPDDDSIFIDNDDSAISGGTGYDIVDAMDASTGVTFDLGVNGIERADGSNGNDTFTSSTPADATAGVNINGRGGNDDISGSSGPDRLYGDAGVDTLRGNGGVDTLVGGADNDTLHVDGDDLQSLGGTGYDTANGLASTTAIMLDLGVSDIERAFGSPGNDTFSASRTPDGDTNITVYGRGGNDIITGSGGADLLYGDADDDTLDGKTGADTLAGGDGSDTLLIDSSDMALSGDMGFDVVDALAATAGVTLDLGASGIERAFGSNGDDVISSLSVPDGATAVVVYGRGGDDQLSGTSGADVLYGEGGKDTLVGHDGSDRLSGGADSDTLRGSAGRDQLYGNGGADVLQGEADNDVLYPDSDDTGVDGGSGFDIANGIYAARLTLDLGPSGIEQAYGSNDDDVLTSSTLPDGATRVIIYSRGGDDHISGTDGPDLLSGDSGMDTLMGRGGNDRLVGGADNDRLYGEGGVDRLEGNEGNDTIYPDADDTYVFGGSGFDVVNGVYATRLTLDLGRSGIEQAYGSPGNDTLTSSTLPDSAAYVIIYGLAGNDRISGSGGPDVLTGDSGTDTLTGRGGNDRLAGGADNDRLYGEGGVDRLEGNEGNDTIYPDADDTYVLGGSGFDTLNGLYAVRLQIDVGANGFEVAYGSAGNDVFTSSIIPDEANRVVIYGRDGDDQITASPGPDWLRGEGGADTIQGEDGNDTLIGGSGPDDFSGGAGTDRILDFVAAEDTKDNTIP